MRAGQRRQAGVTLVEMIVVVVIVGTLSTFGIALYRNALRSARIAKAIQEIKIISTAVDTYRARSDTGSLPETLEDCGHGGRLDPWGNPYMYLNFENGTGSGILFVLENGLIDPAAVWRAHGRGRGKGRNDDHWSGGRKNGRPFVEQARVSELKRKDRFLFPLNSDYDLFSVGPNGKSFSGIVENFSLDDVIRANDGAFFGVATEY